MKDLFTRSKWSKVDLFAAVAATGFLIWAVSPKLFPASQFIQLHEVRLGIAVLEKRSHCMRIERSINTQGGRITKWMC